MVQMEKAKHQKPRKTAEKDRINQRSLAGLIIGIMTFVYIGLYGCNLIHPKPETSPGFYKALYEECHKYNRQLIDLQLKCEKDLEKCRDLGSALESCP